MIRIDERYRQTFHLGLGFVQGMMLLTFSETWTSFTDGRVALSGLLAFVLAGTLQAQLLGQRFWEARRAWLVMSCALLQGGLVAWFVWQGRGLERWQFAESQGGLLFGNLLLFYIFTPFIQAWDSRSGWQFDYTQLYRHAWNNGLILLLAALLVSLFWLLILLWVGLFSLLGIKFFGQLFFNRVFLWISCALVFAVGVRIGLQRDQVIEALRGILLAICRSLLPLTVLIVLLFAISLPFTGLEPLWRTKRASAILLALVFVHLCLLNGVFQDGRQSHRYARGLHVLVDASLLVLPLLAALAGYALWLRVQQYGLTPSRVLAGLSASMALLYAAAAADAVLLRGPIWLETLRLSNPPVALVLAALLVLLQTPLLSPMELSAASQYWRLVSGQVAPEQFDRGLLRFRLGEPGRRYLARLEQLVEQPGALPQEKAASLQAELERLRQSRSYWQWQRSRREAESVAKLELRWLGTAPQNVDGLQVWLVESGQCRQRSCSLLAVDLDGDGVEEVLVIPDAQPLFLQLPIIARGSVSKWRQIGRLVQPEVGKLSGPELAERLRREKARLVSSRYQALEVGGVRFEPHLN